LLLKKLAACCARSRRKKIVGYLNKDCSFVHYIFIKQTKGNLRKVKMQDNGGSLSQSSTPLGAISNDQIELLPTNGVSSFEVEIITEEPKGQQN